MKKGRNTKQRISKYIVSGVLLFSMLGVSGCNNKKLDELTKQVEELKEQVATFESIKSQLETQLAEAKAINEQLSALNDNKDLTIEELTESIETLQNSVNSLNAKITELNDNIGKLEGENKDLQDLVDTLQDQKQQAETTISQLQETIADLEQQIEDLNTCSVTFDLNYETTSTLPTVNLNPGEVIGNKKPENPQRDGYNFVKWVYGDLETDWDFDNDTVNGDITLKAIWSAKTFTITYKLYGGSFVGGTPSTTVTYDTMYTLPDVTKVNHSLSRWTMNNNTFTSGVWKVDSDATLECEWAKTNATITYNYNYPGRENEVQNVTYNAAYTLQQPTRTGYTFKGWKYEGKYLSSGTWKYLDSIELIADWSANKYTLNLDPMEGVLDGQATASVTYDSSFTLPKCQDLDEDRPFAGWFIDNVRITDENGQSLNDWAIDSDKDLEAKYFHVISTKDEFLAIGDNPSTVYGLVNDIDFENVEVDSIDSFSGTLIGLGYSIKNVSFTTDKTTVGLFKELNGAAFEDVRFVDSEIDFEGTGSSSNYFIGLLASQAYGDNKFRNIRVNNVEFDVELDSGSAIAGGLVGIAENLDIEDVTIKTEGNVKSPGNSAYFGGFVGECDGLIEVKNYEFDGDIRSLSLGGSKDTYLGGLVGLSNTVNLDNVKNTGLLTANSTNKGAAYAGGIIGKITERTEMINCSNEGSGNVVSTGYSGGLIGYNSVSASKLVLDDCFNNASVSDDLAGGYVGGLIGRCSDNTTLSSVYNSGHVFSNNGYSGGLVGKADADIMFDSCYVDGNIQALSGTAGGFVGLASSVRIYDSYSIGSVQGSNYAGGFVGETLQVDISKSYIGGSVGLMDDYDTGFVGGFIGKSSSANLNNVFVFADIIGVEGNTNSYVGKCDGCVSSLTYSAATLKSKLGADISESDYPTVNKVDISEITIEFIQNTLQFTEAKWNIEFEPALDLYPTLKAFE